MICRRPFPFGAILTLLALVAILPTASADELMRLDGLELYDLQVKGFELGSDAELNIEAVGRWPRGSNRSDWGDRFEKWGWDFDSGSDHDSDDTRLSVYAWIIDADSREAVWVMSADESERAGRSRTLREVTDSVSLDAGRYELYFYSGHGNTAERLAKAEKQSSRSDKKFGKSRDWRDLNDDVEEITEDLEECFVSLSADGVRLTNFTPDGKRDGTLLAFTGLEDSQLRKQGFRMAKRGELQAYVLVEHPTGDMDAADFAWIVDLETGDWVWDSSSRRGRYAGGSSKNRMFDSRIRLDAGDYVLYYGTDDSHSYERFNGNPPYDPMNWGITLMAGDDFASSDFSTFDAPARGSADIDFSQAGDQEFMEQPFRLKSDSKLHVYALGEMDTDGWQFYDYGWIADAATGETVWEMDDRNTNPAGGAEKNRMFDGEVDLPSGDYIAFYTSDDSHSSDEWNSAAPFDPEAWGMMIRVDGGGYEAIASRDIQKAAGILVSIQRVGDRDRVRERFTLDSETELQIRAIGEGTDGDMYDYARIRNRETKREVWEMEYRDSDHAGGARKNRIVEDTVTLDAGEYEVIYVSDGSHSFEGWNDRRPDDPMGWGVTVRISK